jgi:hypothetical protein
MSVDPYTRPQHWEPMNTPACRAPRCYSRQATSKFVSWSDADAESNMILIALIIASSVAVFLLVYTWTL